MPFQPPLPPAEARFSRGTELWQFIGQQSDPAKRIRCISCGKATVWTHGDIALCHYCGACFDPTWHQASTYPAGLQRLAAINAVLEQHRPAFPPLIPI